MNYLNFTVRSLDDIPAPIEHRVTYHDTNVKGLSLRVSPTGRKTFVVRRKLNNRDTYSSVGHYPAMTISQARDMARQVHSLIDSGVNPKEIKRKALDKKRITLSKVFDDYIQSRGTNLKENTIKGYKSAFKNYLSDWGNKPLSEISRDMVEKRHRDITNGDGKFKESPTRANTVMRHLRAYFNYAEGEYEDSKGEPLFLHNPVSRISHIKAWNREKRKQTVIKSYNLKKWYEAVMELPLHKSNNKTPNSSEVCRDLFIFILFTGLRRREATELKWENIDFQDNSLTIENTKNHETHSLPLTDFLLELLDRRKVDPNSPFIFQSTEPNKSLNDPKKQLEKVREISGVYFNLHDLRRTFITIAESLDFSQYALKKLLNHKDQRDVTGGYIITDMERLREPMNRITAHIMKEIQND